MNKAPVKPCPGCGKRGYKGGIPSFQVRCTECTFTAGDLEEWNRRTPGPATRAMIEWAEEVLHDIEERDPEFDRSNNCNPWISKIIRFLDEWSDATRPASEPESDAKNR